MVGVLEMKHTKEPWEFVRDKSYKGWEEDDETYIIFPVERDGVRIGDLFNEANAKRIVACVNACEGIDTKDLDLKMRPVYSRRKVIAQRDKLIEGLKKIERNCYDEAIVNFTKELIAECEDL